jgi:glutaredoxin
MIPPPSSDGFTVFTKQDCSYCDKVKLLLPGALIVSCDSFLKDRDAFLSVMDQRTGAYRTFPMVFRNGVFLGGYEDTKRYLDHQRLFQEEF